MTMSNRYVVNVDGKDFEVAYTGSGALYEVMAFRWKNGMRRAYSLWTPRRGTPVGMAKKAIEAARKKRAEADDRLADVLGIKS